VKGTRACQKSNVQDRCDSCQVNGIGGALANSSVSNLWIPNWNFGVGALWFDARDAAINAPIKVDNLVIQQAPYEAIQFVSGSTISGVTISNARIQSIGTFVVQEQVAGAATFTNVTATQVYGPAGQYNCGVNFVITDGGGNSGWNTTYCGPWPTPQPPPPVG
jgi:hypothetical protein